MVLCVFLAGNSSFYQRLSSDQAKAGHTNHASRNVASTSTSTSTSLPGDSKQSTRDGNTVDSGVDYEKQSSQQAPRRTLPPSFGLPPVPSTSAATSASRPGETKQSTRDGSIVTPRVSSVEYKKQLSQQARRTLPPSISLPPVPSRSANYGGSGSASRFGGDYTSPAAVGNKSVFGDRHRGAHTEIGIHRGINGVRILPPSMTHGTSAYPLHYGGSSDLMHRTSLGEDRNPENDETLIYQAALQVFIHL